MATGITESELLEALAASIAKSAAPDEAKTTSQMVDDTGLTRQQVERALRQYAAAGRLLVHKVPRQQIDGSMRRVPAYTISSPKAKRSR